MAFALVLLILLILLILRVLLMFRCPPCRPPSKHDIFPLFSRSALVPLPPLCSILLVLRLS